MDHILKVAKEASLLAGAKIREAVSSGNNGVKEKSSNTDLVTETDIACEQLVILHIRQNYPLDKIIGEENSTQRYHLTDSPTWTIDPIDGTTNFVHELKLCCVLISYIVESQVCVGVTYDPFADELFWAIRGKGAFLLEKASTLNDDNIYDHSIPIHVSETHQLSRAVISMDPGYERDPEAVQRFCAIQGSILSRSVRNLRVIGCTGLNMAYVACGRLDGGFEEGSWNPNRGPKIWDFAAGSLLIEEAGGLTRDLESNDKEAPLDLMKRSFFCAANLDLANEILEAIAEGRSKCN